MLRTNPQSLRLDTSGRLRGPQASFIVRRMLCGTYMVYGLFYRNLKLLAGDLTNGIALVRPPGHHAMTSEFNGFCLCNNVAIAAKNAIDNHGLKRILVVDFDAHHGQATQRIFYDSSKVRLSCSLLLKSSFSLIRLFYYLKQ